jgi:hypothetical protein
MTGKLKVVRVLANPIPRKRKSAKVKRRKGTRQRKVRSLGGKWIIRRVGANRSVSWWSGSAWNTRRNYGNRYPSAAAAARAMKAARAKAGIGWVVLDVMPA